MASNPSTEVDSHDDAMSALTTIRNYGALVDLGGQTDRGRNIMAVAVALARCLSRQDDRALGELATRARELLRDPERLGMESDGDAWEREPDWKAKLVDVIARAISDGRAENQLWLATQIRRRLTVNRHNPPTPRIKEAFRAAEPVRELEALDPVIARALSDINTAPALTNVRETAIACIRAALKALGATAEQRKSWLEAERSRRRQRSAAKR